MENTTATTASITFDPATNTYRLWHDWEGDERVTMTIIRAIAIITNTPPSDFGPLFESIAPDALEQLFDGPSGDAAQDSSWVSFRFNDCAVQVSASGTIEIAPDEDANPITAPVRDPFVTYETSPERTDRDDS